MITHAANFKIESGTSLTGYPVPIISHFTSRKIQVQTSEGLKRATEVTIHGDNFIIRAVTPDVLVNGHPLVSYQIADDFQSITGYFFKEISQPAQIVVDYGLGVRGEFTGQGGIETSPAPNVLCILLIILFALLLLSIIVLVAGSTEVSLLGWACLGASAAMALAALLWAWFSK